MNLRKDRIHLQGKANRDFKMIDKLENSVTSETQQQADRITRLATAKSNKFSEILDMRAKRIAKYPDPIEATKSTIKKDKSLEHHQIGYPRSSNLEEKQLRKRVFCGDSNTLFHDEIYELREDHQYQEKHNVEKLAKEKHEERATAIQETQLVGIDNKNTLEGQVDLEKVREIRRAIRRRYANRKNFQKIFNLWDEDSQGAVNVKNLYNMIQRMGININIDEARVLLASVDRDGSQDLGLDEFLDLIFNDKDALNVNLKNLRALSENEKESLLNQETIQFLQKDAKQQRERRHQNQVNLILKNRLQQLAQWLVQADQLQKGYLSFQKFESVIKKLEIDKQIVSEKDVKDLFDNFKKSDETIDYKEFVNHLKAFQLQEEVYNDPYAKKKDQEHLDRKQILLKNMKNQEEQKITVYDVTRINAEHLERMRVSAKSMFNKLMRYIPNQEKFKEFLKSKVETDKITLHEFSNIMNGFLSTVNEKYKISDFESLLSVMQFGQYEQTSIQEITKIIYDEDDQDFFDRVQLRRKGPPPPQNKSLILKSSPMMEIEEQPKKHSFYDKQSGLSWFPPNTDQELALVLQKIDNKIFNKSERAYKLFKDFDQDHDGYISQQDLIKKLDQMSFLDQREVQRLINYIDPNNKGFVSFYEFHRKIRNGVTILDEQGNQIVQIASQPNKQILDATKAFLPELQKQTEEFIKPYRPSTQSRPATRFGSTPPFKDTFMAFVPPKQSPMYLGPDERFTKGREQFQVDEKSHKQNQYENKLKRIQNYHKDIQDRIQSAVQLQDKKEVSNLKSKGMAQWTYEHNAHLKNDYL